MQEAGALPRPALSTAMTCSVQTPSLVGVHWIVDAPPATAGLMLFADEGLVLKPQRYSTTSVAAESKVKLVCMPSFSCHSSSVLHSVEPPSVASSGRKSGESTSGGAGAFVS
jgi:hypothetical protein